MTNPNARPKRQRKGDRLLAPGARPEQIKCDYAIAPLDRLATQMDAKWGVDRLPELMTPDVAARYGAAMAHLNETIEGGNPGEVQAAAENCIRGLTAMDSLATAANAAKPGTIAEYDLDGFRFGIIQDAADQAAIDRPDLRIFTLREIAIALQAQLASPLIGAVKEKFKMATVTKIRPKLDLGVGGDSIPF